MRRRCRRDPNRGVRAKVEAMIGHMRPEDGPPVGFNASDGDRASEDDREWFEAHPRASWRLRRGIGGEIGTPYPAWVVCFQVEPGVRVRAPLEAGLPDEQVQLMGETGDFQLIRGTPVWVPRDEGHRAIAAGRLTVPSEWVPIAAGTLP